MKTAIESNRKSWFTLDNRIKNSQNNKPIRETTKSSLLKRPSSMMEDSELDASAKYMLSIRNAFQRNMSVGKETNDS